MKTEFGVCLSCCRNDVTIHVIMTSEHKKKDCSTTTAASRSGSQGTKEMKEEESKRAACLGRYEAWLREAGVRHPKVAIEYVSEQEGFALKCTNNNSDDEQQTHQHHCKGERDTNDGTESGGGDGDGIKAGEVVIAVPTRLLVNVERVKREWPDMAEWGGATDRWSLVYLFLAHERVRGEASPLCAWLDSLPQPGHVNTPVSCSPDVLAQLAGTNLHEAVLSIRAKLSALFVAIQSLDRFHVVVVVEKKKDDEKAKTTKEEMMFGMNELVWAYEVFWSRGFAIPPSGEAALVPLCGMLNHSPKSKVKYITTTTKQTKQQDNTNQPTTTEEQHHQQQPKRKKQKQLIHFTTTPIIKDKKKESHQQREEEKEEEEECFCVVSEMEVKVGEEFYGNYTHRSNEKLLLNYGFVMEGNELDTYTVKVAVAAGDPRSVEGRMMQMKKQMMEQRKIGWEHPLRQMSNASDCIPSSLIDALRILSMEPEDLYFITSTDSSSSSTQSTTTLLKPQVRAKIDVDACQTLLKLLKRQLEKLPFKDFEADTKAAAETQQSYQMKAVLIYRASQARILQHCIKAAQELSVIAFKQALTTTTPNNNSNTTTNNQVTIIPALRPPPAQSQGEESALETFNRVACEKGVFRGVKYVDDTATTGSSSSTSSQSLSSSSSSLCGVRMVATAPIAAGQVIVSLPKSSMPSITTITHLTAEGSELHHIAQLWRGSADNLLAVFLLFTKDDPFSSSPSTSSASSTMTVSDVLLNLFLKCVPRDRSSPLFGDTTTVTEQLNGTSLQMELIETQQELTAEYSEMLEELTHINPNTVKKHTRVLTLGNFLWAKSIINARLVTFHQNTKQQQQTMETDEQEQSQALLPLPFVPRHSAFHRLEHCSTTTGEEAEELFEVRVCYPLNVGDEVMENCGALQTHLQLLQFGFMEKRGSNAFDVLPITLRFPLDDENEGEEETDKDEEEKEIDRMREHLLEREGLGREHFLNESGVVTDKFIKTMGVLSMDKQELTDNLKATKTMTMKRETVKEARNMLYSLLMGMKDEIPSKQPKQMTDEEEEEEDSNRTMRKKMMSEYCELERDIITNTLKQLTLTGDITQQQEQDQPQDTDEQDINEEEDEEEEDEEMFEDSLGAMEGADVFFDEEDEEEEDDD